MFLEVVVVKFSISVVAGLISPIFALSLPDANAATETVMYSFCSQNDCADGSYPYASGLIDINHKLYGTTALGGQFGQGTLFTFDPETERVSVLYSFNGADGEGGNGLLNVNGTLYGTSDGGGAYGHGAIFSFDLKTTTETVLHSFGSSGDGAFPEMSVPIEVKHVLYGTTAWGGVYGYGTVFSIDLKSGTETILHSFQDNGSDGWAPWTGLTAAHGTLYGATPFGGSGGGDSGCGTVYSVSPQNGVTTVLYSFTGEGNSGCQPFASLLDYKGTFYGTANGVFSFDPQTKVETALGGGANADGSYGGLVNMHGTLYGTSSGGGENSCGEDKCGDVFSVDPQSGVVSVVYSFQDNGSDGAAPYAGLIEVKQSLYGTTQLGGTHNDGTIFKIRP